MKITLTITKLSSVYTRNAILIKPTRWCTGWLLINVNVEVVNVHSIN